MEAHRDVRQRHVRAMPGLAHLARVAPHATFVTLALDYVFWSERCPNALLHFGRPMESARVSDRAAGTARVNEALETTMDAPREAGMTRERTMFRTLLGGREAGSKTGDVSSGGAPRSLGTPRPEPSG